MVDKLIVTNRAALRRKYGARGLAKVTTGVKALIAADRTRGLITRLVALDSAAMKRYGPRLTDASSARQNKRAIDALHRALRPHYLLILGSIDVVPHQDPKNPVFVDDQEDDPVAWGDLPYACDSPYSRDITKFIGPTRVIGRLPDMQGASEPSHLLACLDVATTYKTRPLAQYLDYFALSTQVWKKSTALSVTNIFGNATKVMLAPPVTSRLAARKLGARSHFINCHGALADSHFYGEDKSGMPMALDSKDVGGRIREGTVAAVECCYGAELYDSVGLGLPTPICQTYMVGKAYGYFGSTTIAYGPAEGNGAADLITQYFLLELQAGHSLGLAVLKAQQRYVEQANELDPIDLKTLAQFYLLGDPSVQPVKIDSATRTPAGIATVAKRSVRDARRANTERIGQRLRESKPTASQPVSAIPPANVRRQLNQIARQVGAAPAAQFTTFAVDCVRRSEGAKRAVRGGDGMASKYHLLVTTADHRSKTDVGSRVAVIAREASERIVGYRIYYQR
ncbi:MAG TPA: hypothetical protein VJU53_13725 [Burkholderiaceae bacterium]|nr:hypothetical protein [Burkholderiaceae bacterium]